MKRTTLANIDSLFKPLHYVLRGLKRIRPSSNQPTKSFFVIKFFGMGSIIRIANVIEEKGIPKDNVVFVTLARNRKILEILQFESICIRDASAFAACASSLSVLFRLSRTRNAMILDMERSSHLSGIFRILASRGKPCSSFYFGTPNKVRANQKFIGLENKSALLAISEMLGDQSGSRRGSNLENTPSNKVVVNCNAGPYLPERKYPLDQYAELIAQLHKLHSNWNFVLTGTVKESSYVHTFYKLLISKGVDESRLQNLSGTLSLEELIDLLKSSKMLITNDSGPLHLAQYFKVRTVAIWGPTSSKLVGYPDSEHMLNFKSAHACSPCFLNPKSKVAFECGGKRTCFSDHIISKMTQQIDQFIENVEIKVADIT